jgi:hypothetical protein
MRSGVRFGLIAVVLTLAGCGTSAAPAAVVAPSSASVAAQYDSNTPPAAAQMVCSDEIRNQVSDALAPAAVPAPQSTWVDHVFTCTYALAAGPLVLSVAVAPTNAAAADTLQTMRTQLDATEPQPGLGEQAFGAQNGTVLAVKDNMVLHVDATALSGDLGVVYAAPIDLARLLAAAVFNCWIGNE